MNLNVKTKINKQSWTRYVESLRYSLYVLTHPFDGFWDLTHEKRGSIAAANTLLILTFMTRIWNLRFECFLFNDTRWERINIWSQIAGILAPLLLYVVANWCLTTLFDPSPQEEHPSVRQPLQTCSGKELHRSQLQSDLRNRSPQSCLRLPC